MAHAFATLNGSKLHYQEMGVGPALVLLHAGIAHLEMWDKQMAALAAHYRVIRYDLRGWGLSADPAGTYSHHDDLRALLDHLGAAQATLVGCSYGGKVAIDFALAHPERVTALVLVGTALGGYTFRDEAIAEKEAALEAAYDRGEMALAAELEAQIWVDGPTRRPDEVDPDVRARALAMIRHTHALPEGAGEKLEPDPPAAQRVDEITAPTLLIVGEHDAPDIVAIADLLESKLPLVERVTLRDTAHLPNMERPHAFNRLVLSFLEKAAWRSTVYAIVPHPTQARVLLRPDGDGYALPHLTMPGGRWDTSIVAVAPRFAQRLGLPGRVLYRAFYREDAAAQTTESLFVLAPHDRTEENGRWVDATGLATVPLTRPAHRPIIAAHLQEVETQRTPPQRPPWARPGFFATAVAWIDAQLAQRGQTRTGGVETVRNWAISTILRAPTDGGNVYFKATLDLPLFGNEAAVTAALSQRYPEHVPTPLAVDRERDWMLLPEFGPLVGWGAPLPRRAEMLRRFGQLQVDAGDHVDELLAAGCLDRRLAWMAAQIEPLVHDARVTAALDDAETAQLQALAPRLRDWCRTLEEAAVPQTLVHGDLHGNNAALHEGKIVYFDWTDACITHPFFDMLDIFQEKDEAVARQLRDAYLAQWEEFATPAQLREIWSTAAVLGAVHHTLSYLHIVANLETAAAQDLAWGVPLWARRILAFAAAKTD